MTVVGLSLQKSGFNIEGVRFHTGHLGPLELKISWRHLVDYVRLEMVAGPPTALEFRGIDIQQVGGATVGCHCLSLSVITIRCTSILS